MHLLQCRLLHCIVDTQISACASLYLYPPSPLFLCSVLQCVAVSYRMLQCDAPANSAGDGKPNDCKSIWHCVAVSSIWHCVTVSCSVLKCNTPAHLQLQANRRRECAAVCCSVLLCVAVCCTVCCRVLQHVAV